MDITRALGHAYGDNLQLRVAFPERTERCYAQPARARGGLGRYWWTTCPISIWPKGANSRLGDQSRSTCRADETITLAAKVETQYELIWKCTFPSQLILHSSMKSPAHASGGA